MYKFYIKRKLNHTKTIQKQSALNVLTVILMGVFLCINSLTFSFIAFFLFFGWVLKRIFVL